MNYFSPGDLILYGKYKNKRGRIVKFFMDEKNNPRVEIEPIPKGRRQNKILGLYTIWRADHAKAGHTKTVVIDLVLARYLSRRA